MARGVGAQISLLAVFTAMLILITAIAVVAFGVVPEDDDHHPVSFAMVLWRSLMHALDPGTLGGDAPGWTFLLIMLFITIGGLFVLSALIGVLTQGFGDMIASWRRGRSVVMEHGHTVILGWTPKVPTLLREFAIANANQKKPCVVVLADRDKVDMDADASAVVKHSRLRIVTRRGSPMTMADLRLVNLAASKAVVVLTPDVHADGSTMLPSESDTVVLKTLLAIAKVVPDHQKLHLVAELYDARTESVARRVIGPQAALLRASPLVSRLLVQTGRQSGLSVVYSELLDFDGNEIYLMAQPTLAGKTFRDAVFAFETSSLIGVRTAKGEMLLPPKFDRALAADDELVLISEDDSTIALDGKPSKFDDSQIAPIPEPVEPGPERTLVLGACTRLHIVLHELDAYVAAGSKTLVVGEHEIAVEDFANLKHMAVEVQVGDVTDRLLLDTLDITSFDHIIVLSETADRSQEMADARTMVTLLHLRDIESLAGKKVPITSEILDIQNRDLASVAEADDFIVSNTLVSLMVSQIAENPHLVAVFDELFSPAGFEIYLKPANQYVASGELAFGVVCEAALRRNEVAIGYRLAATARDPEKGYGVVVNPAKNRKIALGASDKVIVLAES